MSGIANVKVYDMEESIRASKYPMSTDTELCNCEITDRTESLAAAPRGSGHDCFLKGVLVAFDLTFSNKAWVEAERYHWFDFVSSQSTMHRITKFDLSKGYNTYVDPRIIAIMQELVDDYNELFEYSKAVKDEHEKKRIGEELALKYLHILYSNPAGFELTARITTNYLQLKTIYAQRHNHRLPEWRWFCEWIKRNLPNSHWITGEEK